MKKNFCGFNLVVAVLICAFCFSGCKLFYSTKLQAPKLSHNKNDMVIYWDANFNASDYEIYMNSSKIDNIASDGNSTQYEYCYEDAVGDFGEFQFQVKSIGAGKYADSELSEAVTVKVGTAITYLNKNVSDVEYVYNASFAPTNVKVEDHIISWNKPTSTINLEGYLVSIYTNGLGIRHYKATDNTLAIAESMMSGNDIMAIKVCAVINAGATLGNINYECKDIYYYNPLDYGVFTDSIYIFDGGVYDYYIENYTELQNLYYYSFIYRIENIKFKVSDEFCDAGENTYFDTIGGKADEYIYKMYYDYTAQDYVIYDTVAYFETSGFRSWPKLNMASGHNEFVMSCDFGYADDPTIKSSAYFTQDTKYTPYYDIVDYEKRSDDYNNFVSDDWFMSTEVNSSEELYWAVSSHITPIFNDTTSNEYIIYNNAKKVLREIISDEMSDYEKALSIFDYIMLNTTYDKKTTDLKSSQSPFLYMCYYLESVLLDIDSGENYAVCDGFAKTYALLCNMEGINCVRIVGEAGGGHAWNKVELNGNWYVVDITWTEIYDTPETNIIEEEGAHTYFLVDDSTISTHKDFSNRYIYSLLNTPKSYNFYINDKIAGEYARVINETSALSSILDYSLKNDVVGVEVISTIELIYKHNKNFTNLLKEAKCHSFMSIEFAIYQQYGNILAIAYDAENSSKGGYLMIVKPGVSITNNTRFNDYIKFIKDNMIDSQSRVSLNKDMIYKWIGETLDVTQLAGYSPLMSDEELSALVSAYIDALSDDERISIVEEYFAEAIGEFTVSDVTYKANIEIIRTEEDVTEEVLTQEEDGTWIEKISTSGEYSFKFNYVEQ